MVCLLSHYSWCSPAQWFACYLSLQYHGQKRILKAHELQLALLFVALICYLRPFGCTSASSVAFASAFTTVAHVCFDAVPALGKNVNLVVAGSGIKTVFMKQIT